MHLTAFLLAADTESKLLLLLNKALFNFDPIELLKEILNQLRDKEKSAKRVVEKGEACWIKRGYSNVWITA